MKSTVRSAFASVLALGLTAGSAQAQETFNVDNAAAVEGLFRGAALHCGEPDFARRFVDVSKAMVAFSLQGEGPINLAKIEEAISLHANDPRFDQADKARMCSDMLPKLDALYNNRLTSLQEAQRAAEALRSLAENQPGLQ